VSQQGSTERVPRPTLRQVAALSGVSAKTVSRVLNDEPYVSDETAKKVRAAAAQLGFRLNALARELRAGSTSPTVGLLIGDVANPFYSRIARGAERELRARGLQLVTASTDEDAELEWSLTQEMLDRRVRGLLIVPSSGDHTYLGVERRHGLPVVFLDRPPTNIVADTIVLDNVGGARVAVQHLLSFGHRRIGLVGDLSRLSTHTERMSEFGAAMELAGAMDWRSYVRAEAHDAAAAEQSVLELLRLPQPPTALFTTNNRITTGALRALRRWQEQKRGRQVPALVGFDDLDLGDLLAVTVISHDPEAMGRLAAQTLLARIDGASHPPRTVVLPTTLVVRGSGERPPARTRAGS
jgi:LacI family transcriptional regulator